MKWLVLHKITNHVDPKVGVVREVVNEYRFYVRSTTGRWPGPHVATVQISSDRFVEIEQHKPISTCDLMKLVDDIRSEAQGLQSNVFQYLRKVAKLIDKVPDADNSK